MLRRMRILAICFVLGVTWAFGIDRARADVEVGDAYAQAGNGKWTIGTHAAEVTLETQNGKLLMSSFVNKLTQPAREYVGGKNAISLLDARVGGEKLVEGKKPLDDPEGRDRRSQGGWPAGGSVGLDDDTRYRASALARAGISGKRGVSPVG